MGRLQTRKKGRKLESESLRMLAIVIKRSARNDQGMGGSLNFLPNGHFRSKPR